MRTTGAMLLTAAWASVLVCTLLRHTRTVHAHPFNVTLDQIIAGGNETFIFAHNFAFLSNGDILVSDAGDDTGIVPSVKRLPVADPSHPELFRVSDADPYRVMAFESDPNVILSEYTKPVAMKYASIASTDIREFKNASFPMPEDPNWECRAGSGNAAWTTILLDGQRTMWGVCGTVLVLVFSSATDLHPATYSLPYDNGPWSTYGMHFSHHGHLIVADSYERTVWRFEAEDLAASLAAAMDSDTHVGSQLFPSVVLVGDASACGSTAYPNDALLAGTTDDIYLITFNDCSESLSIYNASAPVSEGVNPFRYNFKPVDSTVSSVRPYSMHVKDGLLYVLTGDALHRLTLSGVDLTVPGSISAAFPLDTPLFTTLLLLLASRWAAM